MDAAEAVTDRMVRRELYKKGVVNRITRQLSALELALTADLAKSLARLSERDETRLREGNYTTDRLKALIAQVQAFSVSWARIVQEQLEADAIDLIEAEVEFERQYLATFATDAGVALSLDAVITPRQIFTAARRRPMDTTVLKEAFPTMSRNVRNRVVESLRTSYQAGDSVGQAMTRLRSDQQLGINRRGAEGLVRTGLQHYAHHAARDSLQALGVNRYQWISTLDGRTTGICRSLDQTIWSFDNAQAPRVPRHFNCRSAIVAYLGEELEGTRASNGANGGEQVDAALSYEDWLRRQPDSFALQVLGRTQYEIWKTGVPVTRFTDRYATVVYSAAELRRRYSDVFAESRQAA